MLGSSTPTNFIMMPGIGMPQEPTCCGPVAGEKVPEGEVSVMPQPSPRLQPVSWRKRWYTSAGSGAPPEPQYLSELRSTLSTPGALLIAVYMGDQTLFDELWKYEQGYLDDNGLMDWYISADGKDRKGMGGATDADEDMAFALLMASRQWGGKGTLDKAYIEHATDQIGLYSKKEMREPWLTKAEVLKHLEEKKTF